MNDNNTEAEAKSKKELLVPTIRGQMGDWWYYVATLTFGDLAERVKRTTEIHEKKELKTWIQRDVSDGRLQEIAEYIRNQPEHFFNAIVLGLFRGEPDWMPINVSKNLARPDIELTERIETAFGLLHLSGDEDIFAIDGQHRVEGIKRALELDDTNKLQDEEQTVIFLGHKPEDAGRERTRRLFTTLNKYAKPVTPAEIIALSEDDTFAIVTRRLIDSYPGLSSEFVPLLSNLQKNDKKSVTSLITLYEIVKTLSIPTRKTRKHLIIGPPKIAEVNEFFETSRGFFDALKKYVPAVSEVYASDPDQELASKYRNTDGGNLLFRPAGLVGAAKATRVLMDREITIDAAVQSLTTVTLELSENPWRHVIWDATKNTMIPKNTKLIKNLILICAGHHPDPQTFDVQRSYSQAVGEVQTNYSPPSV